MSYDNSWEGRHYQEVGGDKDQYNAWRDNVIDQSGFWSTMGRTMSPITSIASMFGAFEPDSYAQMAGKESYDINTPNREAAELAAEMRREQSNQEAEIRQAQAHKEAMIRQAQVDKEETYRQEMHRMANDRNLAMHNEQGVQQFGDDYSQNKLYPRGGMGDSWSTPFTGRQGYIKNYNNHPTNSFLTSWMYPTDPNKAAKEYQQSYERLPQTIW